MLDTDTFSYVLRRDGDARRMLLRHRPSDVCISAITLAELRYGAAVKSSEKLHLLIDALIRDLAVLPFDQDCAVHYANVANDLRWRGMPIGELDTLIAAHALALDLTLVTNNIKHFERVRGLKLENWL
jgi:tRNA(fMet)-specific endonuclease VapC